jgi:hypothetical protein
VIEEEAASSTSGSQKRKKNKLSDFLPFLVGNSRMQKINNLNNYSADDRRRQ